jgi:hypothetical protein
MSQEIAEALREAIDAFNCAEFASAARVLDADSQWDWSRSIGPDNAIYRGPDEIRRFWETFAGTFEEIRLEIEEVVDLGDRIVAAMLSVMRGRGGVEVQARNAWLVEGRGATLARLTMFQSKQEALEAVGLEE